MNYGRIISIISQASNVPVSDLMRMDNDQLRSTLEKAVQDRANTNNREFLDTDGALYWINDWINEPRNNVRSDTTRQFKDCDAWEASANVDADGKAIDGGALDKLNNFLKAHDLFTIDGETTVDQWDAYYKEIQEKFGMDPSNSTEAADLDNAFNSILDENADWKKECTSEEEALQFFNDNLTDEQKNDKNLGVTAAEVVTEINENLNRYQKAVADLDRMIDTKKDNMLYRDKDANFDKAAVEERDIQRYMMDLTDEQKAKLDDDKYKEAGKYTYKGLLEFKKDVLDKDIEKEVEKYHQCSKACRYINDHNPDLADRTFASTQPEAEHTAEPEHQQASGRTRWLGFAAGAVAGAGLALTASPIGGVVFGTVVASKVISGVCNFVTKWNESHRKMDEHGNPVPTVIDKITGIIPEGVRKFAKGAVDVIGGNTKNHQVWNMAVNGFITGFGVTKGLQALDNWLHQSANVTPTTPTDPNLTTQNNTIGMGDSMDVSNIDHVYADIYKDSGPLNPVKEAFKNVKYAGEYIDPATGEKIVTVASPDGTILGRIEDTVIQSVGKKL